MVSRFQCEGEFGENVYVRYSKAWNFNEAESEKNFSSFITWRRKLDISNVKLASIPIVDDMKAFNLLGFEKSGRPVIYLKVRNYFPTKM
jgi:hypothetical protein